MEKTKPQCELLSSPVCGRAGRRACSGEGQVIRELKQEVICFQRKNSKLDVEVNI